MTHHDLNLAGQQLEDEARDLKLTIDDIFWTTYYLKHLLKKIFDLDSQYNGKYNEMPVIFGSIVALINPRVQFQSDCGVAAVGSF